MNISDFIVYFKFLSRNKIYTAVSILGFSISLMFVILLAIYVKQELSVDDFQENKDRIYLMTHDKDRISFANPIAEEVKGLCPQVDCYTRTVYRVPHVELEDGEQFYSQVLFADSAFFRMFSYKLIDGDPNQVIKLEGDAVVSRSYALKIWGNDNPVGKKINIDNINHIITGIYEDFPVNTVFRRPDFIANYAAIKGSWGPGILTNKYNSGFAVFFMAKKGTDLPSKAPVILDYFYKSEYPLYTLKSAFTLKFLPFNNIYFSDIQYYQLSGLKTNSKMLIGIYTGISVLILIIAMLNYINMTVAQVGFRGKEAAIRKLMGCQRKSIIIQLLTESLLMSIITFGVGFLLAYMIAPFFSDMLNTQLFLSSLLSFSSLIIIIIFILIISVFSGLIPAIIISDFEPLEMVKGEFSRKIKTNYSRLLNVFQYSIIIILLIISFFIIKQINYLIDHDLGFDKDFLYIIKNRTHEKHRESLYNKLIEIPGITGVSFSNGTPITGGNNSSFELDGEPLTFTVFSVDTAFFNLYGITWEPTQVTPSNKTFLVNKDGFNALKNSSAHFPFIHGIVNDFQIESLHENSGLIWINQMGEKNSSSTISVKIASSADLIRTADAIKKVYSQVTGYEIFDSFFSGDKIQEWYDKEKKMSRIIISFTFLTITIMIMGVFAMSMYTIKQKEKGIAIRKVYGSSELEVLELLNVETIKSILIAAVFAIPVAFYGISQWLDNFIYKTPLNWWIFAAGVCIVISITLVSVSWMTWRAATTNPVKALRNE